MYKITSQKRATIWGIFALFWFGISLYGLFLQAPNNPVPIFRHIDKVAHWGLFFVQFYLIGRFINNKHQSIKYFKLLLLAIFWAISSELIQGYFTTRTMDIYDAIADMFGAVCACFLLTIQQKTA